MTLGNMIYKITVSQCTTWKLKHKVLIHELIFLISHTLNIDKKQNIYIITLMIPKILEILLEYTIHFICSWYKRALVNFNLQSGFWTKISYLQL